MTTLSNRTTTRKAFVVISLSIVVMLLMFFIGLPLVKPIMNALHCQNTDRIEVWSIRMGNPISSGYVEVVCADGSGTVYQPPLSSVIENAENFVFSPNGSKVALIPSILQDDIMPYISQDNRDHIWIMNSDGSGLVRLSNIRRHESDPAWSPDSRRLAFSASLTDKRDYGIYVTDLTCVDTRQDCASATTLLVADGGCPAWSPDGKSTAFRASDSSGNNHFNFEIFVIDVNGSNRVNLTHNPADDGCPVWSPDGRLIVFYSWREPSGIYMMNADGSNPTYVTDGDSPKWSPNGQFIAFISARDNDGRVIPLWPDSSAPAEALYLMARNGNQVIKLTHYDDEAISKYFWLP